MMKLHCDQFKRSFDLNRDIGYSFKSHRKMQEVAWSDRSRKRKLDYCYDRDEHREKLVKKLFQSKNKNDMLKNMTRTNYKQVLRDEYRGNLQLSDTVGRYQKELRNMDLSTYQPRMQRGKFYQDT